MAGSTPIPFCDADILRLSEEAMRCVAPTAFGANGEHSSLLLTQLAFNNLNNCFEL